MAESELRLRWQAQWKVMRQIQWRKAQWIYKDAGKIEAERASFDSNLNIEGYEILEVLKPYTFGSQAQPSIVHILTFI
jgi:hypothetical protein